MADYYHLSCYKEMLTPQSTPYQRNNRGMSSRFDGTCQKCLRSYWRGDMIARFNEPRSDSSSNTEYTDAYFEQVIKDTPFSQFKLDSFDTLGPDLRNKTRNKIIRQALEHHKKSRQVSNGNDNLLDNLSDWPEESGPKPDDNGFTVVDTDAIIRKVKDDIQSYLSDARTLIQNETAESIKEIGVKTAGLMQAVLPNLVQQAVNEALNKLPAKEIQIKRGDLPVVTLGPQHQTFETLLQVLMAQQNALLIGPMGSGKTTAARNAAKAVGLNFYFSGAVTDAFQLLGYNDANGKYVPTDLYRAWTQGGLFLLDEIDGSDPSALVAFNAGLANGVMAFPSGITDKHPDCIIFAAANTWGTGATAEYVGRNRLDAATLDRFVPIEWDYDFALEMATAPNVAWTSRVQTIRKAVMREGIRVIVSPRASYQGAALMAAGMKQEQVERAVLRRTMTAEQWNRVKNG